MPLVRVDLALGTSVEFRTTIVDVVHAAMIAAMNVPNDDRFQIVTEHEAENLAIDASYLGIERTPACIFIQVTLNDGRTVDQKRAFYKAVADGLHVRLGHRREDVFVSLVEVRKENWSFGNGEAQYA